MPKAGLGINCSSLSTKLKEGRVGYLKITKITSDTTNVTISSVAIYNKDEEYIGSSCCTVGDAVVFESLENVGSVPVTMENLITLTKEQEAGLSKEDQAFLQLGWINDKLVMTEKGEQILTAHAWDLSKKELAIKAKAEVAKSKNKEAKA